VIGHRLLLHLASFVGAFLLGWFTVPLAIHFARKKKIFDVPDGKIKVHAEPVPYLGGVAVYLATMLTLIAVSPFEPRFFWFVCGLSLLFLVGLVDDFSVMKPWQKFLGQIVAVFFFLRGGFALKSRFFADYVTLFASGFWMLSVINGFNLVDVLDGLATSLAIIAALSFLLVAWLSSYYFLSLLLIVFIGSLGAFLWYNKPSAKIYLGDAGSLFIGGFIAAVPLVIRWTSLLENHNALPVFVRGNIFFETAISALIPVLIVGVPLLEVTSLVILRKYHGLPFYFGSPHHFASYLRRKKWSDGRILCFAICASLTLSFVALLFAFGLIPFFALVIALSFFLFCWCRVVY